MMGHSNQVFKLGQNYGNANGGTYKPHLQPTE